MKLVIPCPRSTVPDQMELIARSANETKKVHHIVEVVVKIECDYVTSSQVDFTVATKEAYG